jgi:hypothetical protein
VLRFPPGTPASVLRDVRDLLATSPGGRSVMLQLEQLGRSTVEINAGRDCRVELTPDLQQKLKPWLAAA